MIGILPPTEVIAKAFACAVILDWIEAKIGQNKILEEITRGSEKIHEKKLGSVSLTDLESGNEREKGPESVSGRENEKESGSTKIGIESESVNENERGNGTEKGKEKEIEIENVTCSMPCAATKKITLL